MKEITMEEARKLALEILEKAERERSLTAELDTKHEELLEHPLYREIVTRKAR